MGGNWVGAGIALAAGALTVTVALALTRTEADGIRVFAPEGKNVPSTMLDLSCLAATASRSISRPARTPAASCFGCYTHYFGADERKHFLDLHPTPGNNSGIAVDERYSWTMGLGARWMLSSTIGVEAMLAAHATRTRVDALSDESCCGSPDNRFRRSRTDWGPMAGIGLRCRLNQFGSGRPITGVLRYTAIKVDDIDVSGRSAFGFDYNTRVNGGWNHSIQIGVNI